MSGPTLPPAPSTPAQGVDTARVSPPTLEVREGRSVAIPPPGPQSLMASLLTMAKLRLTLLVVFSGVIAFLMGHEGRPVPVWVIAVFALAGFATTVSANALNQILEVDADGRMRRTQRRPLPAGTLTRPEALAFALVTGLVGLLLYGLFFPGLAAVLAAASLVMYAFVYTPLKRVSPVAVAVGAVPGAMPLLIGWAAATGTIGTLALVLFVVQFIWQFPHFWSIAWVLEDDYERGGFRLLPTPDGRRHPLAALWMAVYAVLLLPAGWLPFVLGLAGLPSAIITMGAGVVFAALALRFARSRRDDQARHVMLASFLYLPIQQLAVYFDQIH